MMKRFAVCLGIALLLCLALAPASGETYGPMPMPYGQLHFSTTDVNGNAADESILAGAKLVVLNFWEPWCVWCLKEMPDLEALYEQYKDQGLLILGIFDRMEGDGADAVVAEYGLTYPCLRDCEGFGQYVIQGWPTSFFLDGEGNALSASPLVGYQDGEAWEKLIRDYLGL